MTVRVEILGRRLVSPLTVLMLLLPSLALSQERPEGGGPAFSGSRVRLVAPAVVQGPITGTVMEMDSMSLLVSTENQRPLRVPRQAITQFDVSTGRRGSLKKGAIIGGTIGAVLGAVIGATGSEEGPCIDAPSIICPAREGGVRPAFIGAGIGAYVGAFWGGLIGHFEETRHLESCSAGDCSRKRCTHAWAWPGIRAVFRLVTGVFGRAVEQ